MSDDRGGVGAEHDGECELDRGGHCGLPHRGEEVHAAAAVRLCDERDKGAEREAGVPDKLRLLRLPGRGAEGRGVHQRGHAERAHRGPLRHIHLLRRDRLLGGHGLPQRRY